MYCGKKLVKITMFCGKNKVLFIIVLKLYCSEAIIEIMEWIVEFHPAFEREFDEYPEKETSDGNVSTRKNSVFAS